MNAQGDGAEEEYRAALEALREKAAEAIIEIVRREHACATWDYPSRWGLVYASAALEEPAALPFFRTLVLEPIPREMSTDPHSYSTVAEETILRTTAVDGVAALARRGDERAIEALYDFLSVPSFSVKRAAVQGLLGAEQGESLRDRVAEQLCPEDRHLLEIRALDVRKVTQIDDPEAHLSEDQRDDAAQIAPDLPDRRRENTTKAQDRPPRGGDSGSADREG
jgi:HEAT repeat protein